MKKKLSALASLLLMVLTMHAQSEPEYRMEIGVGAGLTTYVGDLNGNLLHDMKPTGDIVARYKLNPRMAWNLNIGATQLKGSSKNSESWLPDLQERPINFKTSLYDVQIRYEYNFWAFGTGREYHGARPFTPFLTLGLGFTIADAKLTQQDSENRKESSFALQMPIGIGVKYKLADRLNLTAEWVMHFTGTDKLDGLHDPYGIRSQGLFKNTDGYSTLQLSLTYEFWERCRTCHNDRE